MTEPIAASDGKQRETSHQPLPRQVGVAAATMMGLGSILGTGIFVSLGIAAGVAGPAVIVAIAVAALVATCNGLSSAQLAANHPVSGGTYEYGYRRLNPQLGFTAGWLFLCAKSASAATAALGCAGYVLSMIGVDRTDAVVPLAVTIVVALTMIVLTGIRRSSFVNILIVSVTLVSLCVFVGACLPTAFELRLQNLTPFFAPVDSDLTPWHGFLEACALMFVAYTGYGRIATLGEEIHAPRRNIPIAIIVTLLISMTLYMSVGLTGIAVGGPELFQQATQENAAPLAIIAASVASPVVGVVVSLGAITAMLGVLLNLILGLSRVVLAMGRRRDLPAYFADLDPSGQTPSKAVLLVGLGIAGLTLVGSVKTTWSFSAFTVLIYYALTNLSALRLKATERLYPAWISWLGLAACLFLAFWVESDVWMIGLGVIAMGLIWQTLSHRITRGKTVS